jgi:hypothetical protein
MAEARQFIWRNADSMTILKPAFAIAAERYTSFGAEKSDTVPYAAT